MTSHEQTVNAPSAFDADAVLLEFEGDVAFVRKLASLISVSVPRYLEELKAAAAAGEWLQVAKLSHAVRGSAGNACATRLGPLSLMVERSARSGEAVDASLLDEMHDAASDLLSEFALWADTLVDDDVSSHDGQ
jgi:HPt (histidine-containing phosphotransfer) domain-containing protein